MTNSKKIKVLIVDDSPTIREYLNYIISTDHDIKVVGTARDGKEAVDLVQQTNPDVVTMDIHMPRMDGYEATRKIMEIHPVPIVIISSKIPEDIENTFRAIKAGAVAVLEKPGGPGHPEAEYMAAKILQTIKLMSEIRVVRRLINRRKNRISSMQQVGSGLRPEPTQLQQVGSGLRPEPTQRLEPTSYEEKTRLFQNAAYLIQVVAIGASTGGPPVIRTILCNLTKGFPFTLLFVQHIASGFLKGMVAWLKKETGGGLPIQIASNGDRALPGHVYFAPDDFQMGITGSGEIVLSKNSHENGLRPSVSYLFRSAVNAYGNRSAGILLTGMGRDGAAELKIMKEKGAVTIAQDRESSVIYGMPGEAVKIDAATHILSPEKIAEFLNIITGR